MDAGQQRLTEHPQHLPPVAALHECADALVPGAGVPGDGAAGGCAAGTGAPRCQRVRQGAQPSGRRQERRAEQRPRPRGVHQAQAGRDRRQPAAAQHAGAARLALWYERRGQPQVPAQIDRGGLAGQERVRACLYQKAVPPFGAQFAAGAVVRLQHHHLEVRPGGRGAQQLPAGGQAGDTAADHDHPPPARDRLGRRDRLERGVRHRRSVTGAPPLAAPGRPTRRSGPGRSPRRVCASR